MVYKSIDFFLDATTTSNVNFCCSNFGAIEFAHNLIENCKQIGFPIYFFAIDEASSKYMSKYCDVINYYEGLNHKLPITENLSSQYNAWSTKEFNTLNWCGWEICMDILSSGRSAMKLDTDIFIKNNFEKDILNELNPNEFDILIQECQKNLLCAGFSLTHSSSYKKLKNIFCHDKLTEYDYNNIPDQRILRNMVQDKIINIKLLSKDLYPSGYWFYRNYEKINDSCNMIHFNSVVGKDNKISTMKKFGYWLV